MINLGQFREDFYYRINVIPIHAPPLRDRKSDIPILTRSLMEKFAENNVATLPQIDTEAVEALKDYNYPGNIRELENILERTIALSETNNITKEDFKLPGMDDSDISTPNSEISNPDLPINEHVNQIETNRIRQALQDSNGNITAAAKILGISFRSLRYRIKKLNI